MAGDAAISPPLSSTCMTLFFFFFSLLLLSHFTMVAASAREGSTQNSKRDMAAVKENGKGLQLQQGTKRGGRGPRPPLQWRQKRFFSVGEHEVPSGPNPISNK